MSRKKDSFDMILDILKIAIIALIGFIIIFGTYWMIRVIELIIGVNFVTEPGGFGQQIP